MAENLHFPEDENGSCSLNSSEVFQLLNDNSAPLVRLQDICSAASIDNFGSENGGTSIISNTVERGKISTQQNCRQLRKEISQIEMIKSDTFNSEVGTSVKSPSSIKFLKFNINKILF